MRAARSFAARTLAPVVALSLAAALAACGGGGGGGGAGSGGSGSGSPTSTDAVLSVTLAGGASPGIDHLWVTVAGVAMNADAAAVYGDGNPGWVVETFAAPVTVDLASAALSQGQSVSLLKQGVSATGTYQQLRLLLVPSDAATTLAASATAAGLSYNDQVQYTDSSGVHVVPLELPDTLSGLRTRSAFTLSADSTTPVAIEWNAQSSLVRRASASGADRFTLRDELQLYNQQLLTALGDGNLEIDGSLFDSISGQLDTTQFCTGASHAGCIHDVVASATSLSADGTFHREVRSVNVSASGAFVLYPLPAATVYDVVLHGGNMETMVVRSVFVDPTGLLKPFPTALSSTATPLVPVLDTNERAVTPANALVPAAGRVFLGQTIAGSGGTGADLPYVLASAAADPATGLPAGTLIVPGGPIHDAVFDSATGGLGTPPTFTSVTPKEGSGAFSVWSQGTLAETTSAFTTLAAGATSFTAPAPVRLAALPDGTLAVTLTGTPTTGADHAEVIVSNDGGTVRVADVSALLAAHGGTVSIALPSGSTSAAPGAALYGVALRTWVTGADAAARWARVGGRTSLASTASASVTLAFP